MKISIVPLAGFIFGVLVFDSRWEYETGEPSHFEFIICVGFGGLKITFYDNM